MPAGLDQLKHPVVLMMENPSFDHMLGALSLVIENRQKKYLRSAGSPATSLFLASANARPFIRKRAVVVPLSILVQKGA